jgi:WhiB family transcriptional regulator, redox-sensing transcriptional regulator
MTTAREAQQGDAWMDEAACRGMVRLFFTTYNERPSARRRRETAARWICASCPVLDPCRERGRRGNEQGMWGGETEEDRAALRDPAGRIPSA